MNLYEVLIISIGLSLDVFAYAMYKGALLSQIEKKQIIKVCIVFGIWQTGALILGNLITDIPVISSIHKQVKELWQVLSALIFFAIGIYMIIKSSRSERINEHKEDQYDFKIIIAWACITSIDAFFAGIGFGFLNTEVFLMVVEIAIITVLSVIVGMYSGYRVGCAVKNKAVTMGGVMLLIGGAEVLLRTINY